MQVASALIRKQSIAVVALTHDVSLAEYELARKIWKVTFMWWQASSRVPSDEQLGYAVWQVTLGTDFSHSRIAALSCWMVSFTLQGQRQNCRPIMLTY